MMKIVKYIADFPSLPDEPSKIDKFEFLRWNIAFFATGFLYGIFFVSMIVYFLWI